MAFMLPIHKQQRKHNLGIAGEYFVTAELTRRGIHASMTYGNAKKADVIAFSPEKNNCVVIEVKTTGQKSWVVGGKLPEKSDLVWVFVLLIDNDSPRYFILTGEQLNTVLTPQDCRYVRPYGTVYAK